MSPMMMSSSSRSNRRSRGSKATVARTSSAPTPPPPPASSAFSKIHLSALFQRRQGRQNGAQQAQNSIPMTAGDGASDEQGHDQQLLSPTPSFSSPPPGFHHSPSSDAAGGSVRQARTWSQPPPPSASASWHRRGSHGSTTSFSRMRRMSSSLASLFSPRYGAESDEPQIDPLLTEVFEIPDHMSAFKDALEDDAGQQEPKVASSIWPAASSLGKLGMANTGSGNGEQSNKRAELNPGNAPETKKDTPSDRPRAERAASTTAPEPHTMTQVSHPRKVGRIAAASDFAPVYERTQKKRAKMETGGREGMLYKLLRFPLLLFIFLIIALEFAAYVTIRQLVNVTEYFVAWRGHKGTLRNRLRKATTAQEWRDIALELDSYLGYESWKCEDASGLYDWILIKKVLHSLQTLREQDDAEGVMNVLELCLRNNFAGIENFRLYSETFFGTKYLIESYLSEVEEALAFVAASDKIAPEARRPFYRSVQKNMGRSALCLSGGGSFGYYHIGVVRALLDSNLLPPIITGTSAGGLIAALACTRSNEELKRLLVPELADRITACEEPFSVWGPRSWRTGARFDLLQWAEKAAFFTRGSMTFAEAYALTGKVLNISVIPSDRHSPVKLLNYHTAPNCIIWSSLLASAAVPGLLNPVCLMQKTRSGQAVPWNWGHRFKDGSLRVDIPLQDLHSLFNVNYPIVSQVNPHVHLFFFAPKGMPGRPVAHRKGKGWRGGFLLSASEHVLKLNLSMNFKIIRDLDLLPSILGQDWSSVFLQRFSGAVTIWPKTRTWDWIRILSDPDRKELTRMMHVGQSVTFPKLHMIENRVRLERAIEQDRRANRRIIREAQKAAAGTPVDGQPLGTSARSESGDGGLATAGPMTQSDTDGTGDDFFSARQSGDGDAKNGLGNNTSAHYRRLQRQLAHGFSRVGRDGEDDGNDTQSTVATPNDGVSDVQTPGGLTPGEAAGMLPRNIRARSMGIDDEDGIHASQVDFAHQDDAMDTVLGGRSRTAGRVPFPTGKLAKSRHGSSRLRNAYDSDSRSEQDWTQRGSMRRDGILDEDDDDRSGGHDQDNSNGRRTVPGGHGAVHKHDFGRSASGRRVNERGQAEHGSESSSSSSEEEKNAVQGRR